MKKYKHTKEAREKIRLSQLGEGNSMFGKHSWNYLGITKEWLEQKYVTEKLSGHDIAKLKNCNNSVIYYWLKKFLIPIKKSIKEYPNKLLCGDKNPNYKPEGSIRYSYGYKVIKVNKIFVREHRYIMEQYLGRKLRKNEVVHHINGIRDDNRIENLIVMGKRKHDIYGKNYIEILQEKIRFLENKLKMEIIVGAQTA